jgi:hypothetical protein
MASSNIILIIVANIKQRHHSLSRVLHCIVAEFFCYFFFPDPKFGCQPAVAPFWLGAAAMVLIFSFFGFLDSRLLLAMTFSLCLANPQNYCHIVS